MGFALGGSFVWSQYAKPNHHQWRPQPASNESQQSTNKDADASHRLSPSAKAHGQGDAGHGEQESSSKNWSKIFLDHLPDWFVALFTAVLSIFTGLLWWSTDKLWKAGEKQIAAARTAADAAMLSAKAAIGLELPFLRIEPERAGFGASRNSDGEQRHYFYIGLLTVSNAGRTRAAPIEIRCGWTFGDELPADPVYPWRSGFGVNAFIDPQPAEPMQFYIHDCHMDVPPDAYAQLVERQAQLWFYLCFVYLDFMNLRHEDRFCWRRIEGSGMGHFIVDDAPAYNGKK